MRNHATRQLASERSCCLADLPWELPVSKGLES